MAPTNQNDVVPQANSRPFLCGAMWGLGLGLLASTSFYFTTTFGLVAMGVVFLVGPAACSVAVVVGGVVYKLFSRKRPRIAFPRFQIAALVGAIVLGCVPWMVETIGLYSFAYFAIPRYPGSRRLETNIVSHHPAAKISVKFFSGAPKEEILNFYDREFRSRNWSTSLDAFTVSAQKPTGILFVYVRGPEKEIDIQWYRHFENH